MRPGKRHDTNAPRFFPVYPGTHLLLHRGFNVALPWIRNVAFWDRDRGSEIGAYAVIFPSSLEGERQVLAR